MELLYGIHPVFEALVAGRREFKNLYIGKGRRSKGIEALLERAKAKGIPVEYKEQAFFQSQLGKTTHQSVAARVGGLPMADWEAILRRSKKEGSLPFILALDGIIDPQNLGSLVRTALAMGVHGIVLPKVRAAPLTPTVSKASSGAMEHMAFSRVSNVVAFLRRSKEAGLWVVGTEVRSGISVDQADLTVGLVVVIGGEDKGIRPLVRKTCDFVVSIPQKAEINSLNAAVAGAMVMYEVVRQRRGQGPGARGQG
jgi:23S rRNA (guanosine2251-2'-O)-methyltransferase